MENALAVVAALGFLLFAVWALAKPFVHAIRIGGVRFGWPARFPSEQALPSEPPLPSDPSEGDPSGVREPRRPTPIGSAGAVALEVEGEPENTDAVAREARRSRSAGADARAA